MMKTYKLNREYRKLLTRCASMYFPGEEKSLLEKTNRIYNDFQQETPSIGGRANMMAGNLDMAMALFAFYEATGRKLTGEHILEMGRWMAERMAFLSKLFDFNKPWLAKLMYRLYIPYAKKAAKNKANGRWGNTWGVMINPEHYTEGCSFHLVGCPLVDFARKHRYMDIMPYLCQTDHITAALIHAKLLRKHTVAEGADHCDYWYVGDRSSASK